jgi:hypothetical protein
MPSGPASVLPAAVGPRTYALPVSSGSVAVRDRIRAERASPSTVRRPGILKKMHRSGEVRHPAAIELTTRLHGLPADRVGWGRADLEQYRVDGAAAKSKGGLRLARSAGCGCGVRLAYSSTVAIEVIVQAVAPGAGRRRRRWR